MESPKDTIIQLELRYPFMIAKKVLNALADPCKLTVSSRDSRAPSASNPDSPNPTCDLLA